MKKFNIMGSLKNPIFKWRLTKNQYIGRNCLKSGAWAVCRFKGGLVKKRRRCFWVGWERGWRGLIPQWTLWWQNIFLDFPWNTLWNILFKDLLTKFCKSIFYVLAVNCYCTYIFKGCNYRFSGLLFRIYFKSSYFYRSTCK